MEDKLNKIDERIGEINFLVAEHILDNKSIDSLKSEIDLLKNDLKGVKEEIKKQKKK